MSDGYRLWIDQDRTILIRVWDDGPAEVCVRDTPNHIWGPPVPLKEEPVRS